MCRSCLWLHSDWSCLRAWQKIFHWNKAAVQSLDLYFMRLKYHRNPVRQRRGSPFCAGFIQNDPLSTNQLADDRQWWKFDSLKFGMAIEMCKILVWEGERPGKPSVLGGWCLHAGRFVCVLSPTSHCLFANSLKNWTSSLIGAWRGSSCSGICVWYTQKPPPPPSPPPPPHLLLLSPSLVALAYFLMVWKNITASITH